MLGGRLFGMARAPPVALLLVTAGRGSEADAAPAPAARLIGVPRAGVLLDLVVVNEPGRGVNLNPATVLGSFRLDS